MHALHGEVAVPKRVAFIPAASALGPRGASQGDRQLRLPSGRASAALRLSTQTPAFCLRRHSTVLVPWTPRKPHVQESLPRARPPGIMPWAGVQDASRTARVPQARREITPSTYWMFGELENPEDPEITKDKTERCGGARTSRSGGPWRTLRPAEGPRSGDHHGAQKTENGDASVAVAGPADLANHGVGGWATPRCSRRTRNQTPNKALYPTGAGGIVSAGG